MSVSAIIFDFDGVIAGRAAGSTVIGLLAAGHIRDGHGARLKDPGAHYLAADYVEVEQVVCDLLSGVQTAPRLPRIRKSRS